MKLILKIKPTCLYVVLELLVKGDGQAGPFQTVTNGLQPHIAGSSSFQHKMINYTRERQPLLDYADYRVDDYWSKEDILSELPKFFRE